ncbi:MAG: DUF1573 domain-containing protein [Bacteroidota bacterium]|nr:DUF1573 domain-containing protein [Bacteroidota bacterium]
MSSFQHTIGSKIKFDSERFDFKTITYGEVVEASFPFTNVGDADLIITNVEQPCGCTTPIWPKEPIGPGAKAEIKVRYNSKDRPLGEFRKTMLVFSNMNIELVRPNLTIKGNTVAAKKK